MIRLLRGVSIAALVAAIILVVVAQVTQNMNRDDTLPTITADSETLEIPCAYTQDQLMAGVTASDAVDGDLTGQIMMGTFSHFIELGVCNLKYVVFDSSEHMASLTRRVQFTDYHSPQFALAEGLNFAKNTTSRTEVEQLFTASDVLDGDLTDWITFGDSDAAYNAAGAYTLHAEVRNSFGDMVSYDFPIHVYERDAMDFDISLNQSLVYLDQGASFDPMAYLNSISDNSGNQYDPMLLDVDSAVDTSVPGLYEVHYMIGGNTGTPYIPTEEEEPAPLLTWVQDSSMYGETWLTVIVQEVQE